MVQLSQEEVDKLGWVRKHAHHNPPRTDCPTCMDSSMFARKDDPYHSIFNDRRGEDRD